jgi:ATP-dependent Clp protease ATP-binding subunit ClpC
MRTEDSHVGDLPFTNAARQLLAGARSESDCLRHGYVGTEHLVLALTRQPDDTATLARLGIDREQVRAKITAIIIPGDAAPAAGMKRPYTWRTKQTFSFAAESARTFGHDRVGVEHLIVGMLHEGKGVGAQVLQDLGLTVEQATELSRSSHDY